MVLVSLLSLYHVIHHILCLNMTRANTSTNWSLSYPCIARAKLNSDMLQAQPLCWEFNGKLKWTRYGNGTNISKCSNFQEYKQPQDFTLL